MRVAASLVFGAGLLIVVSATGQAADVYKIGLVSSQTGPVSFIGDPFAKGAKLAVDLANASGGINGSKVELISYDDEGSADKALVFAKKLIGDDKVSVILGPTLSSLVNAVLPTTEAAKMTVLYDTPVVEPKASSYHFTPWPSEEASYRVALDWMKQKNIKKLAVIGTTDATGESGIKRLQELSASYGVSLSKVERMDAQDKDVTAQLTNITQSEPEAVFFVGSGAAVAVVCKAYTRLGMSMPLAISTGAVSASFPELLKGITPDVLVFPTYKMAVLSDLPASDPNRPAILDFTKRYEAEYKKRADFFSGAGWDLATLAMNAMKTAGTDSTSIRDAVEKVEDFPATMATLSFSPQTHRGAVPDAQVMGQFKDGKFGLVH